MEDEDVVALAQVLHTTRLTSLNVFAADRGRDALLASVPASRLVRLRSRNVHLHHEALVWRRAVRKAGIWHPVAHLSYPVALRLAIRTLLIIARSEHPGTRERSMLLYLSNNATLHAIFRAVASLDFWQVPASITRVSSQAVVWSGYSEASYMDDFYGSP